MIIFIMALFFLTPTIIVFFVFKKRENEYKESLEKYSSIIDIESEIKRKQKESEELINRNEKESKDLIERKQKESEELIKKNEKESKEFVRDNEKESNKLIENIAKKTRILDDLLMSIKDLKTKKDELLKSTSAAEKELNSLKADIYSEKELVEDYGFESFPFEYSDSKQYKEAIKSARDYQKDLVKNDTACNKLFQLTFNNSVSEGTKAQNRAKRMLIRTFNGEVETIIKKVTFRNIETSRKKINKSFESLNKLNEVSNGVVISNLYLNSKLSELDLHYGKKVKEEEEKEKAAEERELLREQKRAAQEIKKELARQEKERKKKEKEIQLREDILKQITDELSIDSEAAKKAREEIESLKKELQDILGREQSISQAELTSAGYVYIISNVGSFGEDIYKIGLTRRLDPQQRITELSSASVPFKFGCHGMIWSMDAVNLENELHKKFNNHRVNKVNPRKEFFNVTFEDIKNAVYEIDPNIELIEDVEAEEYYQTLAIEKRQLELEGVTA